MKKLIIFLFAIASIPIYAQKISELTAASTLGGTEVVPGVQSGNTRKISINQINTFVGASYWKVTGTTTLTGDVTIAGGSNALTFSGLDSLVFQQWNLNDTASFLLTMDPVTGKVERRTTSTVGSGGAWGTITGTLADQTDLQGELDDKVNLVNTAAAISDGASITVTGTKHTWTTTQTAVTVSISSTADYDIVYLTANTTGLVLTFPAGALCKLNGAETNSNTATLIPTSGDTYVIGIGNIDGTNYRVFISKTGQ